MTWRHWLRGLLAAVISGSATTVGAVTGASAVGHPLEGEQLAGAAVGGAVAGAVMYLKQSPVPPDDGVPPKVTP